MFNQFKPGDNQSESQDDNFTSDSIGWILSKIQDVDNNISSIDARIRFLEGAKSSCLSEKERLMKRLEEAVDKVNIEVEIDNAVKSNVKADGKTDGGDVAVGGAPGFRRRSSHF